MKASLKFREDQKPLIRAKVPLSILGLPFLSGIVAGEAKELTLNLGTFFESGPSVRLSYRPNDSWNPFSVVVKTGIGHFGSPISSSMSMSAEFNLLNQGSPSFMLHFRPNFGDFSVKKSHSSVAIRRSSTTSADEDSSIEVVEPQSHGGYMANETAFFGRKISSFTSETPAMAISEILSGIEVTARTAVPVRNRAVVNFRWGVRVPWEVGNAFNSTGRITFKKVPFLVMDKIGIEHLASVNSYPDPEGQENAPAIHVGNNTLEAFFAVKRQLEILQAENGMLKKDVEDLRHEFLSKSSNPTKPVTLDSVRYRDIDRNENRGHSSKTEQPSIQKKSSVSGGFAGKSLEADVSEELKKALKGAAGGS
ncbi:hypothetical protein SAY87_007587 [Trapa incisa]|uniref:Uncharacterized protein n=2 Tax=Trapa TaxID=22665 RepID=A0AAN7L820_TRANT|nr:hypothetical protein SAY87_007587 [Trapa incisa]KAK4776815.1 hypothetical protein SAY86_005503 [Trapa natans]